MVICKKGETSDGTTTVTLERDKTVWSEVCQSGRVGIAVTLTSARQLETSFLGSQKKRFGLESKWTCANNMAA